MEEEVELESVPCVVHQWFGTISSSLPTCQLALGDENSCSKACNRMQSSPVGGLHLGCTDPQSFVCFLMLLSVDICKSRVLMSCFCHISLKVSFLFSCFSKILTCVSTFISLDDCWGNYPASNVTAAHPALNVKEGMHGGCNFSV